MRPLAALSSQQGRVRALVLAERAAQAHVLDPQPNDTIPESYWIMVDDALRQAALVTTPPPSFNVPVAAPQPLQWDQILNVTNDVVSVDSSGSTSTYKVGVLPYNMMIGAAIMSALSYHPPSTPIPTQDMVDEGLTSRCPLILFGNSLTVRAPSCGRELGYWQDGRSGRAVLRWEPNERSGIRFGVDSVVTGPGSGLFAVIDETFSLSNTYNFLLKSCLGSVIYYVQESITKVDHMASHADSTMLAHDLSQAKEAYFYQYTITSPNGSLVAQTNLYRMDHNQVNITLRDDYAAQGTLVAVARRQGNWVRDKWRECSLTPRGWSLDFSMYNPNQTATIATVQDMRMVSAALITLMALRDEALQSNGLQNGADQSLYFTVLKTFLLTILGLVLAVLIFVVFRLKSVDKKMRRFCFKFEGWLLPKRPALARSPPFQPAY